MSFLGHLLDRSTAPVEGVQPRQRSAFEAWPGGVLGASMGGSGVEAGTVRRVRGVAPSPRDPAAPPTPRTTAELRTDAPGTSPTGPARPVRPAPLEEATLAPRTPVARESREPAAARPREGERPDAPAQAPEGPPPAVTPRHEAHPSTESDDARRAPDRPAARPETRDPGTPRAPTVAKERPAAPAPRPREPGAADGRDAPPKEPTLAPRTPASRPDDDAQDRASLGPEPRDRHRDRDPEAPPTLAEPDRPAVRVKGLRPRVAPEEAPRAEASDEATEGPPPIHVSIGRIEVRAVRPEPKPRRTPQRPAPMVSLDEYLERGGRPA